MTMAKIPSARPDMRCCCIEIVYQSYSSRAHLFSRADPPPKASRDPHVRKREVREKNSSVVLYLNATYFPFQYQIPQKRNLYPSYPWRSDPLSLRPYGVSFSTHRQYAALHFCG